MFDAKKIADAVRVIREAYAPLVRTNTVCDGLTAIIDELDPPEPNPEPAFKAGDWVEYNGKQYRISAIGGKGLFDDDKLIMFEGVIWGVSEKAELRKLDPSEVVIRIGCLSGTVRKYPNNKIILKGGVFSSLIDINMLDPDTAALVRELLAAQEEK
jgi:hypothetical protein